MKHFSVARLLYGEGRPEWGDKYEQAIEMFGYEYGTLANLKSISSQFNFSLRSEKLSWNHHRAVAFVDDPDLRAELLADAEPEEGSTEPSAKLAEVSKGESRQKVAAAVGMSHAQPPNG